MPWNETSSSNFAALANGLMGNASNLANGIAGSTSQLVNSIQNQEQHQSELGLKLIELYDKQKEAYDNKLASADSSLAYVEAAGITPEQYNKMKDMGINPYSVIASKHPLAMLGAGKSSTGNTYLDSLTGSNSKSAINGITEVLTNTATKANEITKNNIKSLLLKDHGYHSLDEIRKTISGAGDLSEGDYYDLTEGKDGVYTANAKAFMAKAYSGGLFDKNGQLATQTNKIDLYNTIYNLANQNGYYVTQDSFMSALADPAYDKLLSGQVAKNGVRVFDQALSSYVKQLANSDTPLDGQDILDTIYEQNSALIDHMDPEAQKAIQDYITKKKEVIKAADDNPNSYSNLLINQKMQGMQTEDDAKNTLNAIRLNSYVDKSAEAIALELHGDHITDLNDKFVTATKEFAQVMRGVDTDYDSNAPKASDATKQRLIALGDLVNINGLTDNIDNLTEKQANQRLQATARMITGGDNDKASKLLYIINSANSKSKDFGDTYDDVMDYLKDDESAVHNITAANYILSQFDNNTEYNQVRAAYGRSIALTQSKNESIKNNLRQIIHAQELSGVAPGKIEDNINQLFERAKQRPEQQYSSDIEATDQILDTTSNQAMEQAVNYALNTNVKRVDKKALDWWSRTRDTAIEDLVGNDDYKGAGVFNGTNQLGSTVGAGISGYTAYKLLKHIPGPKWVKWPLVTVGTAMAGLSGGAAGGNLENMAFRSRTEQEVDEKINKLMRADMDNVHRINKLKELANQYRSSAEADEKVYIDKQIKNAINRLTPRAGKAGK